MFSINKIIWLLIILVLVWYFFRFLEKKSKKNKENSTSEDSKKKQSLDAFECNVCGLWSTGDKCNNKDCPKS